MTTVLIAVGSALGSVLLLGLAAWLYVRRQIRKLRAGLTAGLTAVIPEGARALHVHDDTSLVGGGYSTLADTLEAEGGRARTQLLSKVLADTAFPPAVKPRCENCEHWGLEAGQKIMAAHPAFMGAAQWRQPWQMGQKRSRAYIELEQAIHEFENDTLTGHSKGVVAVELRAQLAKTEEFPDDPDGKGVAKNLRVTWSDFGLCAKNKEIRAKTDTCNLFTVRSED